MPFLLWGHSEVLRHQLLVPTLFCHLRATVTSLPRAPRPFLTHWPAHGRPSGCRPSVLRAVVSLLSPDHHVLFAAEDAVTGFPFPWEGPDPLAQVTTCDP